MKAKQIIIDLGAGILAGVAIMLSVFLIRASTPQASQAVGGAHVQQSQRYVLQNVTTTGAGTTLDVGDFHYIGWTVAMQNATGTVKFQCSMADNAPNFAVTSSASNNWDYVSVVDLRSGSTIDGFAGTAFTNSSTVKQLQMRDANFRWCTANLTSMSAGTSTISALPATNQ